MTNKIMHDVNFMHGVVDPRASSNISGYSFVPDRNLEKQWVFVIQETQHDVDSILGQIIHNIKTTQKPSLKVSRFTHSKWFLQANWGRILKCERESYLLHSFSYQEPFPTPVWENESIPLSVAWGDVTLEPTEDVSEETSEDPNQLFIPSDSLTKLVIEYMVQPDEEVLALIEEIKKAHPESEDERQNVSDLITEQIEGLMTNFAQRIFFTGKPIQITENNMFTNDICFELIERLGLQFLPSPRVVKVLYSELVEFLSVCPRQRQWGIIEIENSKIELILEKGAFKLPDPDKIEKDKKWIAT